MLVAVDGFLLQELLHLFSSVSAENYSRNPIAGPLKQEHQIESNQKRKKEKVISLHEEWSLLSDVLR